MASEIRANLISPATASTVTLGSSGQTIALGSGATASGFGGGKILKVVHVVKTDQFSGSTTGAWADITDLSASLTPSATSSKILCMVTLSVGGNTDDSAVRMVDGSGTEITGFGGSSATGSRQNSIGGSLYTSSGNSNVNIAMNMMDTPYSTSSETYTVQYYIMSGVFYANRVGNTTDFAYRFFHPSSITLMEIGA
jgi:hypothetical protein